MRGKPDFFSMKVKLSNRLGTRRAGESSSRTLHRRSVAGGGKPNNASEMVALVFLVSFLLAGPGSWGVLAQSMPAKQVL